VREHNHEERSQRQRVSRMVIDKKEVMRLADALDDGGQLYECAGQVIYGWRVMSKDDPTSEAAAMLVMMWEEIERLRERLRDPHKDFIKAATVRYPKTGGNVGVTWYADEREVLPKDGAPLYVRVEP